MSTLFELLCASLAIINAQNEEMFYYYDCDYQSDWLQDNGSYDPDVHTYTPVQWRNSLNCLHGQRCLRTANDAYISRIISTVGFHSIHLQIGVVAIGVDIGENEWCIIQYKTAATNWSNTNLVQGGDFDFDFDVFIPDNDVYNNQESFKVKIGIDGNAGDDKCFFDDLKLFGIPYTDTPTLDINNPSKNPSRSPLAETTKYPSNEPSISPVSIIKSTTQPTVTPSINPTINPSESQDTITFIVLGFMEYFAIFLGLCVICCVCVVIFLLYKLKAKSKQDPDLPPIFKVDSVSICAAASDQKGAIALQSVDKVSQKRNKEQATENKDDSEELYAKHGSAVNIKSMKQGEEDVEDDDEDENLYDHEGLQRIDVNTRTKQTPLTPVISHECNQGTNKTIDPQSKRNATDFMKNVEESDVGETQERTRDIYNI